MSKFLTGICATALAASVALAGTVPMNAAPILVPNTPSQQSDVIQIQDGGNSFRREGGYAWYNGHRGYPYHRYGYRRYNDFWFPAAAFITGAVIGGAIANSNAYYGDGYYGGYYGPRYYGGYYGPRYYGPRYYGGYGPRYYSGYYAPRYYNRYYGPRYYNRYYGQRYDNRYYGQRYYSGYNSPRYYNQNSKYPPYDLRCTTRLEDAGQCWDSLVSRNVAIRRTPLRRGFSRPAVTLGAVDVRMIGEPAFFG